MRYEYRSSIAIVADHTDGFSYLFLMRKECYGESRRDVLHFFSLLQLIDPHHCRSNVWYRHNLWHLTVETPAQTHWHLHYGSRTNPKIVLFTSFKKANGNYTFSIVLLRYYFDRKNLSYKLKKGVIW